MKRNQILLGLAIATTTAVLVVLVTLAVMLPEDPLGPSARPVELLVTGVPSSAPLRLTERGVPLEGSDNRFVLGERPPSTVRIDWVLGPSCDGCPDRCPAWCAIGTEEVVVPEGSSPHTAEIAIPAPPLRPVTIIANTPLSRAVLGDAEGTLEGKRASFAPVPPGPIEVMLQIGTCPEAARGCASLGEPCPEGCTSWAQSVAVPVGEGPMALDLVVPLPEPETSRPRPQPTPARPRSRPVSAAAFIRFVEAHPEWSRDAAIQAGNADARYLKGWDPSPPPGAATRVTWSAAEAFCATRGGLAPIDAAPITWKQSAGPSQEWRVDAGQPAWRRFDGTTSGKRPARNQAFSFTGFRCRR